MASQLIPLPIDDVLGDVVSSLQLSSSLVLRAPPGAGKTTRIPPALLDAGLAAEGTILVLQPRRVAARTAAKRIANERGWHLGDEVGYQVRFESRIGPRTRLAIMTEGILLRRLLDDPLLPGVAAVVFDEFHERSLASDLALAMVRQIQQAIRPELKIVVMSATLAVEPIALFLGDCPVVDSPGRSFSVEIRYLPHLVRRDLVDLVAEGVEAVLDRTAGDCLVFLPGVGEIRQCQRRLAGLCEQRQLALMQLYGDLPAEQQDAVLERNPLRKIILATNVAETSLTIEGVTGVVDSGLARVLRYDARSGLDRLELSPISRASADQRAGRAGRTEPGACLRLWPEATQRSRPEFELPEIRRVDLAGAVLQILCWIEPDLAEFPWFDAPPKTSIEQSRLLLDRLGAADSKGVTVLGRQIASLPVHPRIGRLLLEGQQFGVSDEVALAAAMLSERDPFLRAPREPGARHRAQVTSKSDVLDRVHAMQEFEERGAITSDIGTLNPSAAKHVLRTRDQLLRLLGEKERMGGANRARQEPLPPNADEYFLRSLLAAYPDRVAKSREPGGRRGVLVGGRGVRLADEVSLGDEELYVCVDVDSGGGEALVRQASAAKVDWLPPDRIVTTTVVEFDEASGKVSARQRTEFDGLLLDESPAALPDRLEVARALAEAAATRLEQAFPSPDSPASEFRARVQCLAAWIPDLALPPLDDKELCALVPHLAVGCRSLAELREAPWLDALRSLCTWQQLQTIDREAPERIEVPSGSRIVVRYEIGRPPILAVRIQEVFGLLETPRVARGRIPVVMHLLAPNMRVAQITDDLASFWANTYALVRKDLRARYPKHSWPEDPYTAIAQQRPGKRR